MPDTSPSIAESADCNQVLLRCPISVTLSAAAVREDFEIYSEHSEVSGCFLTAAAVELQWPYTRRVCQDCGPSHTLSWLPSFPAMAV